MYSSSTPSVYGSPAPKLWSRTLPPSAKLERFDELAEHAARELLSLPLFAEITAGQQEQVALALKSALR